MKADLHFTFWFWPPQGCSRSHLLRAHKRREPRSVRRWRASVGIVDMSESDMTPKTFGAGLGYRVPVGDRLTFRIDGRYTHFSEGGGNALGFGVSIGGLFGQR